MNTVSGSLSTSRKRPLRGSRRCIKQIIIQAIVWGCLIYGTTLFAQTADNVHHFDQPCETCHEVTQSNADTAPAIGKVIVDINTACGESSCHTVTSDHGHPVGMVPSARLPENMPLDQYSRLTCASCHDDTQVYSEIANPNFLIKEEGKDFCGSCHQQLGGTTKERSHWQFTSYAHFNKNKDYTEESKSVQFTYLMDGSSAIDNESMSCLSCHEDKLTPSLNREPGSRSDMIFGSNSNHPIGMDYLDSYIDNQREMQPMSQIGAEVRLIDGQVGCTSCHNLYNNQPNHLAVDNRQNGLCKTCHIK